ncbi:hypothetical protein [Acidithrix ferrooxidans]|uniref:Uncharacterized protein n=1 Tax=Acidithrix ferrooxidans TaxID=1280514 RepID=A0A0D8HJW9_9ACTN|nr:hypothetical protein [Acidithrix ferrooxidans]KJF18228.1 hypothetical protein AXFE_08770 [Acidithrix ferrooxidans]
MSVTYTTARPTGRSSGEVALARSSRLHRTVVAVSIAVTATFALVLARLNPGVSTAPTSSTSASTGASSGTTASGSSALNSTSPTLAPVAGTPAAQAPAAQAPVAATGGS